MKTNNVSDCLKHYKTVTKSLRCRHLLAKIERDFFKKRAGERMIVLDRGAQQDIMLHHKERNLESVKDLIDPFHEQQHPTLHHSLSAEQEQASALSLHNKWQ